MQPVTPTGKESPFSEDEIIVTKTDVKSCLTYANDVFLRVSQLTRGEAIGQPHNLIRHPDMPRSVFALMWRTIEAKGEFFGYVVNLATNGDHYWVFAHVTPSLDPAGKIVGYHSTRRKPDAVQVERIRPLYRMLLAEEARHPDRQHGIQHAGELLTETLREKKMSYDELAFAL